MVDLSVLCRKEREREEGRRKLKLSSSLFLSPPVSSPPPHPPIVSVSGVYMLLRATPISSRLTDSFLYPLNYKDLIFPFFLLWRFDPTRVMASSFSRFLDHTQRRITVSRTPLDEWSARPGELYLTTHNTHNRQTSMPPVGFESTFSAVERPQIYTLGRAVMKDKSFFLRICYFGIYFNSFTFGVGKVRI